MVETKDTTLWFLMWGWDVIIDDPLVDGVYQSVLSMVALWVVSRFSSRRVEECIDSFPLFILQDRTEESTVLGCVQCLANAILLYIAHTYKYKVNCKDKVGISGEPLQDSTTEGCFSWSSLYGISEIRRSRVSHCVPCHRPQRTLSQVLSKQPWLATKPKRKRNYCTFVNPIVVITIVIPLPPQKNQWREEVCNIGRRLPCHHRSPPLVIHGWVVPLRRWSEEEDWEGRRHRPSYYHVVSTI